MKTAKKTTRICAYCGVDTFCHTHHKDRNHFNNSPENLQFLCPSCHTQEHIEELVVASRNVKVYDLVDEISKYRFGYRLIAAYWLQCNNYFDWLSSEEKIDIKHFHSRFS